MSGIIVSSEGVKVKIPLLICLQCLFKRPHTDYNITCNQTFIFQVEVYFWVSNRSPM